jgi:uncharacterized protein HemY
MDKGDTGKAGQHLQEVLRYDSGNRPAKLSLARLAASHGDKDAARTYLEPLLNAAPTDPEASQLWQQLGL